MAVDQEQVERIEQFNDMLRAEHAAAAEYLQAVDAGADQEQLDVLYDRVIRYNREVNKIIPPDAALSDEN